jgi:hypothetical protein
MMTSSPGEHVANKACQMHCLAPLDTTISSREYDSPFSLSNFLIMAALSLEVPVLGVYLVRPVVRAWMPA